MLSEWVSFYVIVGSSAGALTGLMFVVIALNSRTRTQTAATAMRAFATPTIVHFAVVLVLAAINSMPGMRVGSLSVLLSIIGVGGLTYVGWIIVQVRTLQTYAMMRSDWFSHTVLPAGAYASLLAAGILLPSDRSAALHVVAGATLALLVVGINNAWDSAVWLVTNAPGGGAADE